MLTTKSYTKFQQYKLDLGTLIEFIHKLITHNCLNKHPKRDLGVRIGAYFTFLFGNRRGSGWYVKLSEGKFIKIRIFTRFNVTLR